MRLSTTTILTMLSLLILTTATPTPVYLAPRCGQTVYPTFLQALTEDQPTTSQPNTLSTTSLFNVSQSVSSGVLSSRIYQVVGFENIPSNAYGCQLNVQLSLSYPFTSVGNPTLNVYTLYNGAPASITYLNDYTWDKFYPPTSPPFGSGVFGTVTLAPGQSAVINSEACATNLAFVFEIASWVGETASVQFMEYVNMMNGAGLTGVYLTHSC